ncbi:MAG: M55 family metallopeptidase [Fimbriimonadaceae bacterium]|nr:M55 family metallopeptidase [Fimbriimonadaceae bacterium]
MRIYLMTDLEGVAGVVNWDDYGAPGARCYERACELTTLEVNAAVEGFLAAGATDFLVVDGHGHGAIDPLLLHRRARLLTGRPLRYPFGCDDSFAAACQIGQHAKSNAPGGHLSHTGAFSVEDLQINGRSLGEMGCNMLFCGYFGVPTILVSGDQAAADEARELVPNCVTVAVKEGWPNGSASGLTGSANKLHNGAAVHLSPAAARDQIRAAAYRALRERDRIAPFWLAPPYTLRSVLRPEAAGQPFRVATVTGNDAVDLLNSPRPHQPAPAGWAP